MLPRPALLAATQAALARAPVVALLGPRQCGKTTLARQLVPANSARYFDLEDPISLARLEQPLTALAELEGTVVIDEVQRRPELFPLLRVLADRPETPARFLILASASPALLRQSSESQAGRLEIVEMAGFDLSELGLEAADALWLRGGFPRSFLANNEADSLIWRRDFIRTLLESDLPQLGKRVPAVTLQRFWAMLAHIPDPCSWAAMERRRTGPFPRDQPNHLPPLSRSTGGCVHGAAAAALARQPAKAPGEGPKDLFPRQRTVAPTAADQRSRCAAVPSAAGGLLGGLCDRAAVGRPGDPREPGSGPPTAAPNWICWCPAPDGASAWRSSGPMPPG